jgi:cytochrome c oxidase subunit 2
MSLWSLTPAPASFDLPPAMSANAAGTDGLYDFLWWFSVAFTIAVTGLTLYFITKYARKKGMKAEKTGHYPRLEVAWTVLPFIFIGVLFHVGFKDYIKTAIADDGAMEIKVRGQKWSWTFTYPNGRSDVGELSLPVNKPVKFIISSSDVLHSFYVPVARLKKDAVPGMYTTLFFVPTQTGTTNIFCAEYCGAPAGNPAPTREGFALGGHSGMMGVLHIVTQEEFDKMMKEGPVKPEGLTDAQWGEQLYKQNACVTCHSVDGSKLTGPTWKGMFGHEVALTAGGPVMVDENYVRESILKPNAKIVAGYAPVMPPYTLSDKQIDALIEYMKTLK